RLQLLLAAGTTRRLNPDSPRGCPCNGADRDPPGVRRKRVANAARIRECAARHRVPPGVDDPNVSLARVSIRPYQPDQGAVGRGLRRHIKAGLAKAPHLFAGVVHPPRLSLLQRSLTEDERAVRGGEGGEI